jgi:hypothetical protein
MRRKVFPLAAFLITAFLLAGLPGCSQPSGDSGPALLSIEVTTPPAKTYYTKNEAFESAGMILTGYYDNGGSRELTGYTVLPVDTSAPGEKTVTVVFSELETSFSVFVNEYPLEGIALVSPPTKREYAKGEDFDPEGLVLEGIYQDGQRPVEGYSHDFDSSAEGTFTVTLTLNGFTAGFEITVGPAALVSIAVSSPPDKTLYARDEQFLPAGLVISGTYTDGGVKTETEYTLTGTGTGTVGERTVTVTLERDGKKITTTFIIAVSAGTLSYITVTRSPNKTLYLWYEDLDLTGLVVKGKFSDMADLLTLTIHPADISYAKDRPGEQSVTVTFEGQSAGFPVTVKTPKLYFDYGRRISELDPPGPYTYTVPSGRTLVLAPVKINVAEGAPFVWKLNGAAQSTSGEYFSYTGGGGTATVTVGLAGLPETEITTYVKTEASEGTHRRYPDESSKARASDGFEYTPGPGQFVGGLPIITAPATEETVREKLDNIVKTDTHSGWQFSLGGWGGYMVMGFDHSVENIPGQYSLSISGNAFGGWSEPGIVWVSQDENNNGKPDDTWYELKGSETGKSGTVQRYSVTYHTPVGTNGPVWEDNLGNTGKFADKTYYGNAQGYPFWVPGGTVTFTGTMLPASLRGGSIFGYVDCTGPQYYRISDAIQQDGSPIHLQYIDFVKVQCAINEANSGFGEISTEMGVAYDASMPNPDLLIYGADAGGGQYTYQFINTSGYALTVVVEGQSFSLSTNGGQKTITLDSPSTYFAVSGGNITWVKEPGKVTFKM